MVSLWSKRAMQMISMYSCMTKKTNSHSNRLRSRRKEARSLNLRRRECLAFGVSTRELAFGKSRRWTLDQLFSLLVLCRHSVRSKQSFKWNLSTNLKTRTWSVLTRSTSVSCGMASKVQNSSSTTKQEKTLKCMTTLLRLSQKLPLECLVVFWFSSLLTSLWMIFTSDGTQKGVCAKFRLTSKCIGSRKTQPSTSW